MNLLVLVYVCMFCNCMCMHFWAVVRVYMNSCFQVYVCIGACRRLQVLMLVFMYVLVLVRRCLYWYLCMHVCIDARMRMYSVLPVRVCMY